MTVLIFDCDGTLVDSELLHAQVEVGLIEELFGIVSTPVEYNKQFCGAGLPALCAWLEEKTGRPVPPDFIDELGRRKKDYFARHLKPMPYIATVLRHIDDMSKGVASNGPLSTVEASLRSTDLFKWFDPHIYSAQMVGRSKPAPDLFLFAAQNMNVRPQDCIVIEDSPHGVTAALAANMRVLGFTGGSHCHPGFEAKLSQAHRLFSDMRELPELIRQMA